MPPRRVADASDPPSVPPCWSAQDLMPQAEILTVEVLAREVELLLAA